MHQPLLKETEHYSRKRKMLLISSSILGVLIICIINQHQRISTEQNVAEIPVGPSSLPKFLALSVATCGNVLAGQPPCTFSCDHRPKVELHCQWIDSCGPPSLCPLKYHLKSNRACDSPEVGQQQQCCTCESTLKLRGGFSNSVIVNEGLPPVHHYHSNPIIPRLPDPRNFGRTYRPDPTPIGYLRNNLLQPHEKEAIEKEYWDVIEGRNDDWLYRNKLEKMVVRFLPDFAVVPDEELKSSVRFQRYLYDRLAAKHSKRLQGLNPQWMPVLRFYKWVCAPCMIISWWINSPYLREMENRHCFDDLSPWTSKFGIWYSDEQREYRPPNLNYHH